MPTPDETLCCDVREVRAEFRPELSSPAVATKTDLKDVRFDLYLLRNECNGARKELGELRNHIDELRFDLLKWSCAFWIAQVIGVAGLMMLRIADG